MMKIIDVRDKLPTHKTKQYHKRSLRDLYYIAIHHSLTKNLPGDRDIKAFARYHVNDLDWPGIGYHYVVDRDNLIYKCNSADIKTYHIGKHNQKSLGICLVGDFRTEEPLEGQYNAAIELAHECANAYNITINNIKGHSEFPGYDWKKCPELDMNKFREVIRDYG
jgi:hypothetical protein